MEDDNKIDVTAHMSNEDKTPKPEEHQKEEKKENFNENRSEAMKEVFDKGREKQEEPANEPPREEPEKIPSPVEKKQGKTTHYILYGIVALIILLVVGAVSMNMNKGTKCSANEFMRGDACCKDSNSNMICDSDEAAMQTCDALGGYICPDDCAAEYLPSIDANCCPAPCGECMEECEKQCSIGTCSKETNYECSYETISPCHNDGLCEPDEYPCLPTKSEAKHMTQRECTKDPRIDKTDCPATCDDDNKMTLDYYDYTAQKCVNEGEEGLTIKMNSISAELIKEDTAGNVVTDVTVYNAYNKEVTAKAEIYFYKDKNDPIKNIVIKEIKIADMKPLSEVTKSFEFLGDIMYKDVDEPHIMKWALRSNGKLEGSFEFAIQPEDIEVYEEE